MAFYYHTILYVYVYHQGDFEEHMTRVRSMSAYRWFENKKIKAFYNSVCAPTFRIGVQVLLQVKLLFSLINLNHIIILSLKFSCSYHSIHIWFYGATQFRSYRKDEFLANPGSPVLQTLSKTRVQNHLTCWS
jgi:hypothetical protein